MLVCKNCNTENIDLATFCSNCGKKLDYPKKLKKKLKLGQELKSIKSGNRFRILVNILPIIIIIILAVFFVKNYFPSARLKSILSNKASEESKTKATDNVNEQFPKKPGIAFVKDGKLWIYTLEDKSLKLFYSTKYGSIDQIQYSPNGKKIAIVSSSSEDKPSNLRVLEVETKQIIFIDNGKQPIWFPDSNKLLFSDESGRKKVFYISNKKNLIFDRSNKLKSLLGISPDGKYIISYNPQNYKVGIPRDEIFVTKFNDKQVDKQSALWIFDYSTNLRWKNNETFFAEKPSGGSGGNDIYEITIIDGNEFKSKYVEFGSGAVISPDKHDFVYKSKEYYEEGGSYIALAVHNYKTNKSNVITPAWPNGMGSSDPNYIFWSIENYEWIDNTNFIFSKVFYKGSDDLEDSQPIKVELWTVNKNGEGLEKISDMDNTSFSVSN